MQTNENDRISLFTYHSLRKAFNKYLGPQDSTGYGQCKQGKETVESGSS